jgi:hypothetical protein
MACHLSFEKNSLAGNAILVRRQQSTNCTPTAQASRHADYPAAGDEQADLVNRFYETLLGRTPEWQRVKPGPGARRMSRAQDSRLIVGKKRVLKTIKRSWSVPTVRSQPTSE